MSHRIRQKPRRIDEDIPLHARNIDDELRRPVGIYGENVSNCVFSNCTFVDVPTPIYIKNGKNNVFWNNRSIRTR
jgi:hypothetical protein